MKRMSGLMAVTVALLVALWLMAERRRPAPHAIAEWAP